MIGLVVDLANAGHVIPMPKPRSDRYDYAFSLIAMIFTFSFLAFANEQGWSVGLSIILLVALSLPVGLALAWLKHRLQSRHRNIR